MRRVNIKTGLVQRLNDMLGQSVDDGTEGLTEWAIQTAVEENIRRVVKGIVGNSSYGRAMKGMLISRVDDNTIQVSAGYGFTNNGDIIVLSSAVELSTGSVDDTYYVFAKHDQIILPENEDGDNGGKKTNFVAGGDSEEIVSDDLGAVRGGDITVDPSEIIEINTSQTLPSNSHVYLGEFQISDSVIATDSFVQASSRGLDPNDGSSNYIVENIIVRQALSVAGAADFSGVVTTLSDLKVKGGLKMGAGETAGLSTTAVVGSITSLVFVDGVLTQVNS